MTLLLAKDKATHDKLVAEAQAVGLELIGKGKDCRYRLYRFITCGHEQELHLGHVRINEFRCHTCINQKLKQEASEVGLQLISKGKDRRYRLYKFTECGHEQEINIGHVRINEFRCRTCGDHAWVKPSYLYKLVITCGSFQWLKVGYAKDVQQRIKAYGLPSHATVEVLSTTLYETGEQASQAETKLLKELKAHQLDPEFMSQYHTKSGATECFQISY